MKILLLAGGDSSEREVSIASGEAIYNGLVRLGHKVFAVDPSTGKALVGGDGKYLPLDEISKSAGSSKRTDIRTVVTTISSPGFDDIDVVFIAMHGGMGENGTIQSLLEILGKKYTGCNMVSSALAMDKALAKRLFHAEDIPTPHWSEYRLPPGGLDLSVHHNIITRHRFPIIVKPNDGGSTIGLSIVREESQLSAALDKAFEESNHILVEDFIEGREMTVSVLDGKPLPVVEIIPTNELYDYEAKYTKGKSKYVAPAEISDEATRALQDAAARAYHALDAVGLCRIDFILTEKDEIYCLEVNTIPGMTDLSLSPMAAYAAGMTFEDLLEAMTQAALNS